MCIVKLQRAVSTAKLALEEFKDAERNTVWLGKHKYEHACLVDTLCRARDALRIERNKRQAEGGL